jgi:hypothetical protein
VALAPPPSSRPRSRQCQPPLTIGPCSIWRRLADRHLGDVDFDPGPRCSPQPIGGEGVDGFGRAGTAGEAKASARPSGPPWAGPIEILLSARPRVPTKFLGKSTAKPLRLAKCSASAALGPLLRQCRPQPVEVPLIDQVTDGAVIAVGQDKFGAWPRPCPVAFQPE